MLKSRFIRRSLLTLAVTATPGIAITSSLMADATTASQVAQPEPTPLQPAPQGSSLRRVPGNRLRPGSRLRSGNQNQNLQQVQHQVPGQQTQGNSAVLQELNKLFKEGGQEMPSMRTQDLPYAQTPRTDLIKRKPTTTSAPEKKPSLLGKIFGRFRKSEPQPAEQANTVPKPPPIIMPNGMIQGAAQPTQNQPRMVQQPRTAYSTAPQVQQPRTVSNGVPPAQYQPNNQSAPAESVYRSTGQSAPAAAQPRQIQATPAVRPQPVQPEDDGFIDPFADSAPMVEEDVMLDLDSLIEATPEENQPIQQPAENDPFTASPEDSPAESVNPFEQQESPEPENPFTGVELDMGDEQFFGTPAENNAPAGLDLGDPSLGPVSDNPFELSEPNTPMEDFGGDLPAIDLPPVDNYESDQIAEPLRQLPETASQLVPANEVNQLQQTAEPSIEIGVEMQSTQDNVQLPPAEPEVEVQKVETPRVQVNNAELIRQQQQQIRREIQLEMIKSRSDQAGFKGFCPVVLRDQRDLLDSASEFTSTFGLKTYRFSSAEAQATFESDPSRYAPAAGGSDVVLLINTGEEQEGSLEFALWYRDRLYMFRSRETMALFSQNPARFANQY